MGLNLGICREEEKTAKKKVLIEYMLQHLKVDFWGGYEGGTIFVNN